MTGSSTAKGIDINISAANNDSEGGDMPTNSYLISNNAFSDGMQHLNINCLVDHLIPFYIFSNSFFYTNQSSGNGVWARKIRGYFKNNYFYDNGFSNAITFSECYVQMLENSVRSSQTNLNIDGTTTAIMQPAISESGEYFWNAGRNKFTLENTNNSEESNVRFNSGCILAGDKGENCFILPTSVNNNTHITGEIANGDVLNMRMNYWQPLPPISNLNGEYMEYYPNKDVCEITGQISSNIDVVDVGFGVSDTVFIQQKPAGGGFSSSGSNPKYIFTECLKKNRAKHYSEAITFAKQILNSYDTSKYFLPALDELFSCYQASDTVKNQQTRYALFNSLAVYIVSKINQYQTNSKFVDKAYRYYLMCITKMKNYQEAVTGYENIIINHSNPVIRLTASWDRASLILKMNNNSGGGGKDFYNDDDFPIRFEELMKEKPIHEIADKTYSDMKQDYSQKLSKGMIKSADKEKDINISKRVSVFTVSTKKELEVKINSDIKALLGLKTTIAKSNSLIPKEFSLSQNYPNPFNPVTKISYALPVDARVKLVIYDILGREIKTLVNNEFKTAGSYVLEFNGSALASGVYFYRIQSNDFVSVKRMVLIK